MQKPTIYRVFNSNKSVCYKVATTKKNDAEILDIICPMFEGGKNIFRVYKNDILIKEINAKKKQYKHKPILEVNTGIIFKNISEMKDVLLIDTAKALDLVKRSFNYRYVNEND